MKTTTNNTTNHDGWRETVEEIACIRRRLSRIPYSLLDVEAREAAERLCQEAEAAAAFGDVVGARRIAFLAGVRSDEVRS